MSNLGWPVKIVAKGGIPVTNAANGLGTPCVEADNGVAVTFVESGGYPLTTGVRRPAWLDGAIVGALGSGGALPESLGWKVDGGTGLLWEVARVGLYDRLWCLDLRVFGTNVTASRIYPSFQFGPILTAVPSEQFAFSWLGSVLDQSIPYGGEAPRNSLQSRAGDAYLTSTVEDIGPEWGESLIHTVSAGADRVYAFILDNSVDAGASVDITVRIASPEVYRSAG